jgi:hypothetical protein
VEGVAMAPIKTRKSRRSIRHVGSQFVDARAISCHFTDPILSHLGGLEINAEGTAFLFVGLGLAIFSRKRLEWSTQWKHLGFRGRREEASISMKWAPRISRAVILSRASLKSQAWRPTLEFPELRDRSYRETRGAAGIRHRSALPSSLGAVSVNVEPAMI